MPSLPECDVAPGGRPRNIALSMQSGYIEGGKRRDSALKAQRGTPLGRNARLR